MLNNNIISIWSLLTVFLCFCIVSLLIKFSLGLKFFHRKKQAEDMQSKDKKVLLHFTRK